MRKLWRGLAGVVMAAAMMAGGAAAVVAAAPAGASTTGCRNNASAGCGSQEMQYGHMVIDVYQQHATSGNKIVFWVKSNNDPAQDFTMLNYNGQSGTGGPDKTFEYSPNGVRSGLCLSFPSETRGTNAVLRKCNEGIWQTFEPQAGSNGDVAWKNLASNFVWDDAGFGNAGTPLGQWTQNGGDNQALKYVQ